MYIVHASEASNLLFVKKSFKDHHAWKFPGKILGKFYTQIALTARKHLLMKPDVLKSIQARI